MLQERTFELTRRLVEAFLNATINGERSDEQHMLIAREVRSIPWEVVDDAFADALQLSTTKLDSNHSMLIELLIVTEQFADRAGADRFAQKTRSFIGGALKRTKLLTGETEEVKSQKAQVRVRYLALASATGTSMTFEILEQEQELQVIQPLLWLDLAVREYAPDAFVNKVKQFLELGAFHPFALIPRLKTIARMQGTGSAQDLLDTACRYLYSHKRFNEAEQLIERANIVERRGWKLPFGGQAIFLPIRVSNVEECIEAFLLSLKTIKTETDRITCTFREMLTPFLAFSENKNEEQRRERLRQDIFTKLEQQHSLFEKIRPTGLLPHLRNEDSQGIDWWQDLGPWRKNLPKEEDFEVFCRSYESIIPDRQSNKKPIHRSDQLFRGLKAAESCGF